MFFWSVRTQLYNNYTVHIWAKVVFIVWLTMGGNNVQQQNVIWATLELFVWARSMPKEMCCLGHMLSRYLELF